MAGAETKTQEFIIRQLAANHNVLFSLLHGIPPEQQDWRPAPEKWSMLEILCHLIDEEVEDFRARVKHTLETPNEPMPKIDPVGWVKSRDYAGQDYHLKVAKWVDAREKSIEYLQSLKDPKWDNAYQHPHFGSMSAAYFLANWLAHDYLHIRQINRYKHTYLKEKSGIDLSYAGNW